MNICKGVLTHQFIVSIIVVFTKYDQFLRNVKIELEDYGNPYDNLSDEAERQFEEHYLRHIDGRRFVRLESPFNIKREGDVLTSSDRDAQTRDAL